MYITIWYEEYSSSIQLNPSQFVCLRAPLLRALHRLLHAVTEDAPQAQDGLGACERPVASEALGPRTEPTTAIRPGTTPGACASRTIPLTRSRHTLIFSSSSSFSKFRLISFKFLFYNSSYSSFLHASVSSRAVLGLSQAAQLPAGSLAGVYDCDQRRALSFPARTQAPPAVSNTFQRVPKWFNMLRIMLRNSLKLFETLRKSLRLDRFGDWQLPSAPEQEQKLCLAKAGAEHPM